MASSSSYSNSAPASSSFSQSCNWDVFLSFRGEDTRKTFVDHLYTALADRTIYTYKDDETLPRGDSIGPSLFKAIEGAQIAVVIFSKNYANSSWCLEELAYIMQCKDKRGLTVMPVFYDVDPSDVRKQKGDFGRGFTKQKVGNSKLSFRKLKGKFGGLFPKHEIENTNKVESWRKALVCASEIAGWEPKNIANGHESKVIKEIVDTTSDKLFIVDSYVDENLVGMSARLQELEAQLDIGSHGVRMVGVWGVGGGGKTTLASSLCMKISRRFQGHCIIENIREKSSKHGLEGLQENLISRLMKKEIKLQSVEEGKHIISRLNHSNVLIVLDDVDDGKQLDALVGSHKWFGSGSRIVITTRDEHVLRAHKVDHVFPVTLLSNEEAIMLFNNHAYNKDNLVKDYEKLSLHVVSYSNGLPLALKVLGSFLYDKDEKEWMSSLARLKDIPETEIVEKLKISYDGLKNMEKELFLDIACFFRGGIIENDYRNHDAMEVFDACGYHPVTGIKVLSQKSLITIVDGRFEMHDLVQEMGHYIARGQHSNNPEKHSRIWKKKEIRNMCLGDAIMENNKIEAIKFAAGLYEDGLLSPMCKILSNMKKLRWINLFFTKDLYNKNVEGPDFLSNELQYIRWHGYPTSPFPDSFQPKMLATLKLDNSLQKQLWNDYKHLPNLKVLELTWMKNLLTTPNFDGLPCLQKLKLFGCAELQEIHPSLGKHTSLECVSILHCEKLRMFPTIVHMGKLETLKITDCHNSLEFPEIISKTKSLVEMYLDNMGIDGLLSSIGNQCPNLISINLTSCSYSKNKEVNFYGLKHIEEVELHHVTNELFSLQLVFPQLTNSLRKLNLKRCYLKDGEILSDICELSNLQELDLSDNDFTRLDLSLLPLTRLKILKLSDCELLVELPKLPSGLCILKADRCKALTTVGECFTHCKWLCEVSIIDGGVITDGSRLLQSMLEGNALNNPSMFMRLEGVELAKAFRPPLVKWKKCRLKLPENWSNDYSGILLCTVGTHDNGFLSLGMNMEPVMSSMDYKDDVVWEESAYHKRACVWYVSFASIKHTTWWDSTYNDVLFSLKTEHDLLYSGFGVRLVGWKSASASRSGPSEEESEFSNYTPRFRILDDSTNALRISKINRYI